MKKFAPLLALTLVLLYAGCSAGQEEAPTLDPETAAQALLDSGAFAQTLEALDGDMIAPYLGLADEPEQGALYTSLEGGYEEFAVLVMADETAAENALSAIQAHVEAQRATEADVQYKPGDLPKLERAFTQRSGCVVVLAVADDYDKVQTALNGN